MRPPEQELSSWSHYVKLGWLQTQESHGQPVFVFNWRFEGKGQGRARSPFSLLPPRTAKGLTQVGATFFLLTYNLKGTGQL